MAVRPLFASRPPRPAPSGKTPARPRRLLAGLASLGLALLVWEAISRLSGLPAFILPAPGRVAARWLDVLADGSLWRHTQTTLVEVLAGLLVGSLVAAGLGYLIAKSPALERALTPYIVASQAVPVVALAPLLVIWLGPGLLSKVVVCALIVFFPLLINAVVGLRSVPPELRDVLRGLEATPWQMFVKLEAPAALPVLLGGLKIGATLAVIGAVVGELVGADSGLGFLVNVGRGQYDTALVFVAIGMLVLVALCLYGSVVLLERRLLRWKR